MADPQTAGWTLEPAQQDAHAGWSLEPAEEHGLLATGAHYAAKALPVAGGILGGISGAAGGAAVGLPTGPGAIAASAIGAGAGAGMGAAAGKGLQHVVDTALGYEKPIANANELENKAADMAKEGLETGAATAVGETGLNLAMKIPGVGKVVRAIPEALGSLGNKLAARMLKGTATDYKNLGPEGVQKLGDFLVRKNAVGFGSSPAHVAERVAALPGETGQALGQSIEALDATGGKVSKQALADRFSALAQEASSQGPGAAQQVARYQNAAQAVMQDIADSGEPMMSFKTAENWKRAYQEPINYAKAHKTPIDMGQEQIASAARQHVEDAAGVAGDGSDLGDAFLKAKAESGLAQQAAKMAEGGQGRQTARGMVGPVAKAASYVGAGGALISGNVPAAAAALAGPPAMQFVAARAPAAAAISFKAAASGMTRLQSIVVSNPSALGRYGAILSKALSEGDQSFAAHSYALSQTDPTFQELNRRLATGGRP